MAEATPDPVTLPCGCFINCVIEEGERQMRVSPCRLDCPNLRDALGIADETDTEVRFREC